MHRILQRTRHRLKSSSCQSPRGLKMRSSTSSAASQSARSASPRASGWTTRVQNRSRPGVSPAGLAASPPPTTSPSKLHAARFFGLLGPNGAGKSTTFKMMCGLLRPSEGAALVDGLDLYKAPSAARARLGYMAQKFSLYGDLSVAQNLDFFAGAYGLSRVRRRDAIARVAEAFDLHAHMKESAGGLPLGFKQRLALSCAIMHEPPVLFLDEPTSGVDPLTRREFWGFINAMVARGVTIMVTTHFMDEAEYCDRVALIYRGKCIAVDTPEALQQSVKSARLPNPTLEDAFISLVEAHGKDKASSTSACDRDERKVGHQACRRGRSKSLRSSATTRPGRGDMTTTRSDRRSASSTSWVTEDRRARVVAHTSCNHICRSRAG